MALVLGTNSGFVTSTPSGDPGPEAIVFMHNASNATKDTSPTGDYKITEIGWYAQDASSDANFEVGLYSDEGNSEPETRLFVDTTNAKGTSAGWKTVSVNWSLSSNTVYWIAVQLDNTERTDTYIKGFTASGWAKHFATVTTLPADWGTSSATDVDGMISIYALVEEISPASIQGISQITGVQSITL